MTNWRVTWFSGSDTYLYTLSKELKKRGHKVVLFTEYAGLASRFFLKEGIEVWNNLPEKNQFELKTEEEFDVIHGHHNSTLKIVDTRYPDVPKLFVCHGVLPNQETPPEGVEISKYIAVSQETKEERMKKQFNIDAEIIPNPIDLERFYPLKNFKFRKNKLRIVIISNYFGSQWDAKELIQAVENLGAELNVIGSGGIMTNNPAPYVQQADIVISLGRGILEGMACGKPVIIGDYNGWDGPIIDEKSYDEIKINNFSGRRYQKHLTSEQVEQEILAVVQMGLEKIGKNNREIIEKFHDVKKIADRFETIYKELSQKNV